MNHALPIEPAGTLFVRSEIGRVPPQADLSGGRVVVAVDGLERAGFEYEAFKELRKEFLRTNPPAPGTKLVFVPVSSRYGDMILKRGSHIDWYEGPTLAEALCE